MNYTKLQKTTCLILLLCSTLLIINLTSCASEPSAEAVSPKAPSAGQNNNSLPLNYEKYQEMKKSGKYTFGQIFEYLDEWNKQDPYNPDLALADSEFYFSLAFSEPRDEAQSIPDSLPYVSVPIEDSDGYYLVYRDHTIDTTILQASISFLDQAIEAYPEMIDLWINLIDKYSSCFLFEGAHGVMMDFLDQVESMEKTNKKWITTKWEEIKFNEPISNENLIVKIIIGQTYNWMVNYPLNYEMLDLSNDILLRLLDLYPDNSLVYNELGLVYLNIDSGKALSYFEKTLELAPEEKTTYINIILCSILLNDQELFDKYSELIYESEDMELIDKYQKAVNKFTFE